MVNRVRLGALGSLGVDDRERWHVATVAVGVGPDRRWRCDPKVVSERPAFLERGHECEDFRRRPRLHAGARSVAGIHGIVDGRLARPGAECAVDRDGPDVAGAWLDQYLSVRVVAGVVIVRISWLDEAHRAVGSALVTRAHGRADSQSAGGIQRRPCLGVQRIVSHDREHVVAEERGVPGSVAQAASLQRHR